MKPFFDYMQTSLGLEPLQALFGAVITSAILAFFLRHLWKNYDDARALYLSTQPLVDDELRLMQERHDTVEEEARVYNQATAVEVYNALAPDERLRHDKGYELHQRIENFKENTYWENYQGFVQRALSWARLITGEVKDGVPTTQLFTLQSYLLLLFLAIFYPVLFALGNSVVSESITLAGIELIKFESRERAWLYLSLLSLNVVIGLLGGKLSDKSIYWYFGSLVLILVISLQIIQPVFGQVALAVAAAVALAGALAVALAVALAGALAGAFAVAGALAGAFAGAGAGAVAGAVAGAGAVVVVVVVAIFYVVNKLLSRDWSQWSFFIIGVISILFFAYFSAAIYAISEFGDPDKQYFMLIPVFMGLLPLFNALLDWVSFNITRFLTHKILADNHSLKRTIGFAILDLAIALALVVVVSSITLTGLASLSWIFDKPIVDLADLMRGLGDAERVSEHIWVHAMVLSTLIPTLFHFGLVLYSFAIGWVTHWRREHIDNFFEPGANRGKVFEYAIMRRVMMWGTIAVMGFGIWQSFGYLGSAGCWLWNWADGLLLIVDPFYQTPKSVCLVS